jgi:DNA-binding transcriptional regulator LsrR (DeoR family)
MPGVDLTIVPLQGNWVEGGLHVHNDQVCRDAAHSLHVRALSLPAPMLFDRADTRDALLRDRSIRPVTSRWSELDMAVVGVGPAPSVEGVDYLSVMGQLPDDVRTDLQQHGVVGDLCAHMFDEAGHFVEHEVSRRTLSISIDELRRVPRVVAVAGGLSKAISLLGAVRTGIPKVLITDQLAAESLSALVNGETNHHDPGGAGGFQRS